MVDVKPKKKKPEENKSDIVKPTDDKPLTFDQRSEQPNEPSPQAIKGGAIPNPNDPTRTVLATDQETAQEIGRIEPSSVIPSNTQLQQQQQLGEQREQERLSKEPLLNAVLADAQESNDRLTNLAAAGLVGFTEARGFIENSIRGELGLEPKSDEELRKTAESLAEDPIGRLPFAALGKITTAKIGGVSLPSLFDRSTELSDLRGQASDLRETSEATLRSTRDSLDYTSGIQVYETLIEASAFKHSEIQRLLKKDPKSMAAGITDATSQERDLNRLISDLGILQRAQITGDPNELNRRVIEKQGGTS